MSHFYDSLHPDDVPPSHRGDQWPDDEDDVLAQEDDDALTEWLGGRQGRLDEVEDSDAKHQRSIPE